jgi:glycine cleavage system aminomethyltransferase T
VFSRSAISRLRSVAYGYTVGAMLAFAYLPKELAEGDTVDGWVVRAISPDRVVLVSPDGELVLPAR